MIEVRFHRALYREGALEDAIRVYAQHAEISRADSAEHLVVQIASPKEGRAERVARELANYALGLTIQARREGDAR